MFKSTHYAAHPAIVHQASNATLRDAFLIGGLFEAGQVCLSYVHQERMIIGGAAPLRAPLRLPAYDGEPLLTGRELGVVNIGEGQGRVTVDGLAYDLAPLDALYVAQGARDVVFTSLEAGAAPRFYLASTPAHCSCQTRVIAREAAKPSRRGGQAASNGRLIHQYIGNGACPSAQLLLGLTLLNPGNVWNSMPPHLHERRSEVYFYFNMAEDERLFHFMGPPSETRHILVDNEQAVICPSWSVHMGVGVASYAFIWAMGGDNRNYDDMRPLALGDLG
ncbi:MAG: 5-dehydro-4-deoxy-D-glucuronate isomerase [Asticcacaulis sp.]